MANVFRVVSKLIALAIILTVLSGVGSNLLPANEAASDVAEAAVPPLGLILVVFFFQTLALAIPVLWARWNGWKLSVTIFIVYFATVTALTQIESLVYLDDKMSGSLIAGLFAMGFCVAVVFAPICVLVLGRWKASSELSEVPPPALNLGKLWWRIGAAGLVYLCLYYLFGYYIAWQDPALREYYGGTDPGSFVAQVKSVAQSTPWMIPLQYLRALMYVGLGLLVIYSMRGPWWRAGLAVSTLFAVPALYLLFPNPIMPDFPRMTHLIETLPYQFLFGWFLAWLLSYRAGKARTENQIG